MLTSVVWAVLAFQQVLPLPSPGTVATDPTTPAGQATVVAAPDGGVSAPTKRVWYGWQHLLTLPIVMAMPDLLRDHAGLSDGEMLAVTVPTAILMGPLVDLANGQPANAARSLAMNAALGSLALLCFRADSTGERDGSHVPTPEAFLPIVGLVLVVAMPAVDSLFAHKTVVDAPAVTLGPMLLRDSVGIALAGRL